MGSESERCVDELLKRMTLVDETTNRLENTDDKQTSECLFGEGRVVLTETQTFLDNNKSIIPGYTLKKITDSLRRLEEKLNVSQKSKLKFRFNSAPQEANSIEPATVSIPPQHNKEPDKIDSSTPTCGFKNLINQELILSCEEVRYKDVSLQNLEGCKVRIYGLANTVYIRNLKNSKVEVCLACRAISIIDCVNCDFMLVCQQLRIDSTHETDFEVYTSARSMLESSDKLQFKCLKLGNFVSEKLSLKQVKELFEEANFNELQNNWNCIDDFDWLSPTSPSKNFCLVEV